MFARKLGLARRLIHVHSTGKEKRIGVYANTAPTAKGPGGEAAPGPTRRDQFDGQVVRVWSGDQIVRLFASTDS